MSIGLTVKEHLDNESRKLYGRTVDYNGIQYILGEVSGNTASLYKSIAEDQPDFIVELSLVTFL